MNRTVRYGTKDADPGKAAGQGAAAPAPGEVTLDEIKRIIGETVGAQMSAALPEHLKKFATAESVADAVKAAFAEQNKANQIKAEDLSAMVKKAVDGILENARREKKALFDPNEALRTPRTQIEIPVSWSKGNLPLHGKQLLNCIMKGAGRMNEGIDESDLIRGEALGDSIVYRMASGKALTSTGVGTGDELVPSDLSSELQRRIYLESALYQLLASQEIVMPTQPYSFPLSTTRPTFYLESTENTAATATDPGTGALSLDAKRFMGRVDFSYELNEDSIVPILPWIQQQLAESAADTYEGVILNGDTTATHQDSDIHAVAKHAAKAFKGFRKLALAVNALKVDLSTGGLSAANLRAMLKAMGKYGVKPANLVLIVGAKGYNDLLAVTDVMTRDKAGPQATLFNGTLASIWGVPIVVSAQNREDLNATGVYDGTTSTKGSVIVVDRRAFLFGRRREFTVETDRDITSQTTKVVASFRRCMVPVETPSAAISTVVCGYNYTA